jgi:hypothetical protein
MNKYVYVHYLKDIPIYVGSGNSSRPFSKQYRSEQHVKLFNNVDFKVQIIVENLTEYEAKTLEQNLIDAYLVAGVILLNKAKTTCQVLNLNTEVLEKYVKYDETSPTKLRWIVNTFSGRGASRPMKKIGETAGSLSTVGGYCTVNIDKVKYQIHRVVWVLHNDQIPDTMVIDHINRDRLNNSIHNLRCVTQSVNSKNKIHRMSNTGVQNVSHQLKGLNRGVYIVSWSVSEMKSKTKGFAYGPKCRTKDEAFALAINLRDDLVTECFIVLTIRGI